MGFESAIGNRNDVAVVLVLAYVGASDFYNEEAISTHSVESFKVTFGVNRADMVKKALCFTGSSKGFSATSAEVAAQGCAFELISKFRPGRS